jgi:RNA polymerase sigma-70 factor (ECF subfamily)
MYNLCLRYAGNTEDANDWFQDGFLKLIKNLNMYRGEGSFEGWARKIFVTTCIDHQRKRSTNFAILEDDLQLADDDKNIERKLDNNDLLNIIRRLPDAARIIINLNLIEGYSHKEIGAMLNITEEGSRSQLFRARAILKKLIDVDFGSEP